MTASPLVVEATRIVAAAFLVAMMLSMGLALGGEPAKDKAAKRRTRRLLLRALAFNLVLLPLVAVTLTRAFRVSDDVAIAFLLLAASPGGRFAPQLGKLAGADLGVSVEITLFLAKLVSFTAPVTARVLLHTHHIELRELPFIAQLVVLQLAPYIAGRQLRKRRPALAARIARPVELVMWTLLAVVVALVFAHLHGRLAGLAGARGWWPVLAFAALGPALGWLLGGPAPQTRRALAISANARDVALASVMASLAFGGSGVPLATLVVWLLLLLADLAFVRIVTVHRLHPRAATGGVP
ncbi:MAG TPA: bile acid:sodium symporter [Polyangia bacterium]